MPITFDTSKGTWKLYDATDEETTAIVQIAAEHLCEAFGAEATQKILKDAAAFHESNPEASTAGVEIKTSRTLN